MGVAFGGVGGDIQLGSCVTREGQAQDGGHLRMTTNASQSTVQAEKRPSQRPNNRPALSTWGKPRKRSASQAGACKAGQRICLPFTARKGYQRMGNGSDVMSFAFKITLLLLPGGWRVRGQGQDCEDRLGHWRGNKDDTGLDQRWNWRWEDVIRFKIHSGELRTCKEL